MGKVGHAPIEPRDAHHELLQPKSTDSRAIRELKVEIFRQKAQLAEIRADLLKTRADLKVETAKRRELEAKLTTLLRKRRGLSPT